jgi:phage terminase small subunit
MSLTAKQARFVEEYLIDLNATQAAVRAGYSARNADKIGPELLGKTRVAEAIKAAQQTRSDRTGITQDEVIRGLKKEATLEGEGSSHSARVAAWAHLGKHLGIFTENFNVKGGGPVTFVMKLHEE